MAAGTSRNRPPSTNATSVRCIRRMVNGWYKWLMRLVIQPSSLDVGPSSLSTSADSSTSVRGIPARAYTMQKILPPRLRGVTWPYPVATHMIIGQKETNARVSGGRGVGTRLPMVVTTVLAKNRDCPKLQFGSPVTFFSAETPLLLARTTSLINSSKDASEGKERKLRFFDNYQNIPSVCVRVLHTLDTGILSQERVSQFV